jgi:hypothetical protein
LISINYIDDGKITETFMRKKVAKLRMFSMEIKGVEKKMV